MQPGVVTESLLQLIAKQVDDRGLVVWYDPEQAFGAAAELLHLPGTTIVRYDGSFLQVRNEINHLVSGGEPPRLVIYVPMERADTHSALIELDCAGVVVQPRLSLVARNALKPILGDKTAADVEKQVEAGKLSLADLDAVASKGQEFGKGVVSIVFGTGNPPGGCPGFPCQRPPRRRSPEEDSDRRTRGTSPLDLRRRPTHHRLTCGLA